MSTEINRVLLLIGLFVTGYMLVLAWEQDYGDGAAQGAGAPPEHTGEVGAAGMATGIPAGIDVPTAAGSGALALDNAQPASGADVPDVVVDTDSLATPAPGAELGTDPLIEVQTDLYQLWINPQGGDIVQIDLKSYPVSLQRRDQPTRLLSQGGSRLYIAQSGLRSSQGPDAMSGRAAYHSAKRYWTMPEGAAKLEVPLSWRGESGISARKTFIFDRGAHHIEVRFDVVNNSSSHWNGNLFAQIKHDGQSAPSSQSNLGPRSFEGAAFTTTEDSYLKLDFDDLAETPFRAKADGGWVALLQHYFLAAWVPAATDTHSYYGRKSGDFYQMGLLGPNLSLAPGASGSYGAVLYAGPKIQKDLAALAPHLDLAVDYGFLWWLAQPLFWLLEQIYNFIGNWGLAIIGLTFVVKLVLYPLSAMAYHSMANMRKLAPEMKRLQERYQSDRQKLSQEMMAFYRKEKINPLGGCFPILLQMPVFLALYWVLYESVELRQAPFMLWIEDLSLKDPYFVLPILMGVTMYAQQFLNPPIPDPMQARIIRMMPIVFTLFFLFFPSGLVLYWFINNILSMAQQYWVNYQHRA